MSESETPMTPKERPLRWAEYVWLVLEKDLRIERRSGEIVATSGFFARASGPDSNTAVIGTARPMLISTAPRHLRPSLPLSMKMPLIAR